MMWLIRKADSRISRPIEQESLIAMIEAGDLLPEDEVCASGEYWFVLREVDEVRKFFGSISLERLLKRQGSERGDTTSTTISAGALITQEIEIDVLSAEEKLKPGVPFYVVRALIVVLVAFSVFMFLLITSWLSSY